MWVVPNGTDSEEMPHQIRLHTDEIKRQPCLRGFTALRSQVCVVGTCPSWCKWLLTRAVPLSTHQPTRMHQAGTLPGPACPSTSPRAPLCTALAKCPFYHLNKILLGSCPPRTRTPSFWREPRQPAWHLHNSPVAKVMAKTRPWKRGHKKTQDSLCLGHSKRTAWANWVTETTAVSPGQIRFQPWLALGFQLTAFNMNAPIKKLGHSIIL